MSYFHIKQYLFRKQGQIVHKTAATEIKTLNKTHRHRDKETQNKETKKQNDTHKLENT